MSIQCFQIQSLFPLRFPPALTQVLAVTVTLVRKTPLAFLGRDQPPMILAEAALLLSAICNLSFHSGRRLE
jgi:hypothetical protein